MRWGTLLKNLRLASFHEDDAIAVIGVVAVPDVSDVVSV